MKAMPPVPPSLRSLMVLGTLLLLSGCARLDYVKVPTPTQYANWSDEQQRAADKMKGVRYYLPRPYVHLKQSTPVAQRTALVSFQYDEKEKGFVLERPEELPTWLRKVAPKRVSITQALALTLAPRERQKTSGVAGQGEQSVGTDTAKTVKDLLGDTAAEAAKTPGPDAVQTPRPPSELHARTGFLNSSDPVTRLGSRFDIVYLPDFEEQYVIQPKSGLGKADIETQLRNGWAAEVFSQKVDNSNLIPYVINQFENASEAAANIFMTWAPMVAGVPPVYPLAKEAAEGVGGQQGAALSAEETQRALRFLGEVLLFKIAEVRIAQPGIYPIVKKREVEQVEQLARASAPGVSLVMGTDGEHRLDLLGIRQDMAFIPCSPYTVVGFNTTSDVFISPATERIALIADDKSDDKPTPLKPEDSANREQALKKLESAFRKESAWPTNLSQRVDFTANEPTVLADAKGNTKLILHAVGTQNFDTALMTEAKDAVRKFFKKEAVTTNNVTVPWSNQPQPTIVVGIDIAPEQLAEDLR